MQNTTTDNAENPSLDELKRRRDEAWATDHKLTAELNAIRRKRNANRKLAWEMESDYKAARESHTDQAHAADEAKRSTRTKL